MLTGVTLENFKSFKNETVFDLSETKYQILKDTNTNNGVLKGALLIGANATGKSNLIGSIKLLLDLLFSDNFQIKIFDFCLFNNTNSILCLKYDFKIDEDTFTYKIEADKGGNILTEQLLFNSDLVLDRKGLNATIKLNNNKIYYNEQVVANILFLKKAYFSSIFAEHKQITSLMNFLKNSIYLNAYDKKAITYNNIPEVLDLIGDDRIEEINNFFKDYNLGFNLSREKRQEVFASDKGKFIVQSDKPVMFLKRNDMQLTLPLYLESLGNTTLLNLIPSLLFICNHSGIFLIDEFSSGFHNFLEELVLSYFMKNSKDSQIIFTSHSTNLLDSKLLRPDQIYTVEFAPNEGSKIDRVSSENPRESQNLEKMYLSGKFGGIPNYGDKN